MFITKKQLLNIMKHLVKDDRGSSSIIEDGIWIAVIVIGVMAIWQLLGPQLVSLWQSITNAI